MNRRIIQTRQRWVLNHPCRVVDECGRLGYRADYSLAGHPVATVLTIDLFTDPLAWHADVAMLDVAGKAKPLAQWSESDRMAAFDLARQMLEGVGNSDRDFADCDEWKIGIVRPLTASEANIALQISGKRPLPESPVIGEISTFDFNDPRTEADQGIYAPQTRRLIHVRGN